MTSDENHSGTDESNVKTLALVLAPTTTPEHPHILVEKLTTDIEILLFEEALRMGVEDPLSIVYEERDLRGIVQLNFDDFVEGSWELCPLSVRHQRMSALVKQWFSSRVRYDSLQAESCQWLERIAQTVLEIINQYPEVNEFTLTKNQHSIHIKTYKIAA